jgi:hypothetical protein
MTDTPRDTPPADRDTPEQPSADRRRRRDRFLRERHEALALRERVQPRRARIQRLRHQLVMRSHRW